jgi:hypothetical protein
LLTPDNKTSILLGLSFRQEAKKMREKTRLAESQIEIFDFL